MTEFISTSDGRISFRRDEYLMHLVQEANSIYRPRVTIWTKTANEGRIVSFSTDEEAIQAGMEITAALTGNEEKVKKK